MTTDLRALTSRFATEGRLEAIILRPARDVQALLAERALALEGRGLDGDRSAQRSGGGKRQVTLIQAEHLPLIAAWCHRAAIDPRVLRRNLIVSGLNLLSARSPFADRPLALHLGEHTILQLTGPCDPCSKMEAALGPGAYNALRGHGGVTARVLRGGWLAVGDTVRVEVAPVLTPSGA